MDNNKIKISSGKNINLTCTIATEIPVKTKYRIENKTVIKSRRFKYDTGAQFTCLNAKDLDIQISEEEFKELPDVIEIEGIGIDESSSIEYFKLQVENFVVAGIDFGSVPIYITFDTRAQKRLLGLDIIKLMNTDLNFDRKEIKLSKTSQFLEFKKRKLRLEIKDMFQLGIYSKDVCKDDIDLQMVLCEEPEEKY